MKISTASYLENMTQTEYRKIPNLLRRYRKSRGLSVRRTARLLGLKSASRISRWELGKALPNWVSVIRFSAIYRTLPDALFPELVKTVREDTLRREEAMLKKETSHQRTPNSQ